MKSPNWKEEELKLALELYLSKDLKWLAKMSDATDEIQLLSQLLNGLDFYTDPKPEKFRSCGSIRMKLSNFKSVDERYGKASLSNIGNLDRIIWNKYKNNYECLRNECRDIVSQHFIGIITPSLKKFISRYQKNPVVSPVDNDFVIFAKNTYILASGYKKKAEHESDIEFSHRMIDTCIKIMDALEWCNESINQKTLPKANKANYKSHGGVNIVPVNEDGDKIGRHVQNTMEKLLEDGIITEEILNKLTDAEWTQHELHLGHPFLLEINLKQSLTDQLRDKNGHVRYWKKVYTIDGKSYCICKEWYESGRKYFDKWVNSLRTGISLGIDAEVLKGIVTFIKRADEQFVCIKREKLFEAMGDIKDKNGLLQKLFDIGLVAAFQGTERELVVEDYDLLFKIIAAPQLYI